MFEYFCDKFNLSGVLTSNKLLQLLLVANRVNRCCPDATSINYLQRQIFSTLSVQLEEYKRWGMDTMYQDLIEEIQSILNTDSCEVII